MIKLSHSNISAGDIFCVTKAMKEGKVSTAADVTTEFENKFCGITEFENAIATNSGTSALHLALIGIGVKAGDEVILPVSTFVSTANVILYMGAKPVFCDIDPLTWNIDIDKNKITKKTKAVIIVDLYGNPCKSKSLGIPVVHDCAESLGSIYSNSPYLEHQSGYFSEYSCFSFNGNKIITTGAGGMLCAANKEKSNYLKNMASQNKMLDGRYGDCGYNYKMPALNAALGLSQLDYLYGFLNKKSAFNQLYRKYLRNDILFQCVTKGGKSNNWLNTILFPKGTDIENIIRILQGKGMETRRIFRPLNHSNYLDDGNYYKHAEEIWERGLCLPSSTELSEDDILNVCEEVNKCF